MNYNQEHIISTLLDSAKYIIVITSSDKHWKALYDPSLSNGSF